MSKPSQNLSRKRSHKNYNEADLEKAIGSLPISVWLTMIHVFTEKDAWRARPTIYLSIGGKRAMPILAPSRSIC